MTKYLTALGIVLLLVSFAACGDDDGDTNLNNNANLNSNANGALCGDGEVDPGEACDGDDVQGENCASQGFYAGPVVCTDQCELDLSLCDLAGWCGDGNFQSAYEQCDGSELYGMTCGSLGLGYDAGTLSCGADCTWDDSLCTGCGDGAIEGDESCDDGNGVVWDGCNGCEIVEFAVDRDATSFAYRPDVAVSDVGFVIAWDAWDATTTRPFVQRYDAQGVPAGSPIALPLAPGTAQYARVAMEPNGRFVVSWTRENGTDTLVAQRFDETGQTQGSIMTLHSWVDTWAYSAAVALDASGYLTATWSESGSGLPDTDGDGVYARRFDPQGQAEGAAYRVNAFNLGNQNNPRVKATSDGTVLIVWTHNEAGGASSVRGQYYDAQGAPVGANRLLATPHPQMTINQIEMDLTSDGRGVLAWSEDGPGQEMSLYGLRLTADGSPEGAPFEIGDPDNYYITVQGVGIAGDGSVVALWADYNIYGEVQGLAAQRYSGLGAPQGDSYYVNQRQLVDEHVQGRLALMGDGRFVTVWSVMDLFMPAWSGYAQKFDAQDNPLGLLPW